MGLASFIQSLPEAGGERETQRSPPPPPRGRRTVTGAKVEPSGLGRSLGLGLLAVLTGFQGSASPPDFWLRL